MNTLARRARSWLLGLLGDWQLPWAVKMHRQGRLAVARVVYRRILRRIPGHFSVLQLMGLVEFSRRRFPQALRWLERAREIRPDDPILLAHLGCVYLGMRRTEDAEHWLRKARALRPADMSICFNLGQVCLAGRRMDEAIALFEEAQGLAPGRPEPLAAQAWVLRDMHRFDEAAEILLGLQRKFPQTPQWMNDLLPILVLTGRHQQAFALLRERGMMAHFDGWLPPPHARRRTMTKPQWRPGIPLDGKVLLVHAEAGLGDVLQAFRMALLMADRGAQVVLEVWPELLRLLQAVDPRITVVARGDPLPPYDLHAALEHLPFLLELTPDEVPPPPPLIPPPEHVAAWAGRLGPATGRLRVGYACTGNPRHGRDHDRSMRMVSFLSAMMSLDIDWVCLQRDLRPVDTSALVLRPDTPFFGKELRDFLDTAALVESLDLVVSVDTSVAHLAAAMGKPTWILVSYVPDPRWMLDRDDSPWYPSVRLFRQGPDAQWGPVLKAVARELKTLSQAPRALRDGHSTEAMATTISPTAAQSCQWSTSPSA